MRTALFISVFLHAVLFLTGKREPRADFAWAQGIVPVAVESWAAPRVARTRHISPEVVAEGENSGASFVNDQGRWASLNEIVANGNEPPIYPLEARRNRIEGTVKLRMALGAVNVFESSGHAILDRAALDAAKEWALPGPGVWIVPVQFALVSNPQ